MEPEAVSREIDVIRGKAKLYAARFPDDPTAEKHYLRGAQEGFLSACSLPRVERTT